MVIGLPYFGKQLVRDLKSYDSSIQVVYLNTYYSKLDRFKFLLFLPFYQTVLSINGSTSKSSAFDLAIRWKKKLFMIWVGSDVLLAKENHQHQSEIQVYKTYAKHLCEVSWIQQELAAISIPATVAPFVSFDKQFTATTQDSKELKALIYIAQDKEQFYGIEWIIEASKQLPKVQFTIVGSEGKGFEVSANIKFKGWVKDMNPLFQEHDVCIRIPEHDGLSVFVLESLARGKQVIYRYPFNHTHYAPDEMALVDSLKILETQKASGQDLVHHEGIHFIQDHYQSHQVIPHLLSLLSPL